MVNTENDKNQRFHNIGLKHWPIPKFLHWQNPPIPDGYITLYYQFKSFLPGKSEKRSHILGGIPGSFTVYQSLPRNKRPYLGRTSLEKWRSNFSTCSRRIVIESVLATDMAKHFETLSRCGIFPQTEGRKRGISDPSHLAEHGDFGFFFLGFPEVSPGFPSIFWGFPPHFLGFPMVSPTFAEFPIHFPSFSPHFLECYYGFLSIFWVLPNIFWGFRYIFVVFTCFCAESPPSSQVQGRHQLHGVGCPGFCVGTWRVWRRGWKIPLCKENMWDTLR